LGAFLSFHTFPSNLTEKLTERLKLSDFETSGGVDYKFLNFGVNIEKVLKLHGLKMHFPQNRRKKRMFDTSSL
jgi:hypothetical protein